MSENAKRPLGIIYSLFSTSDGEVFSGGGEMPRDAYIEEIAEMLVASTKRLTDENPHRTLILYMDTEPPGPSVPWTTYEFDDTWKNKVLDKLCSFFYRIGFRLSRMRNDEKRVFILSTKGEVGVKLSESYL